MLLDRYLMIFSVSDNSLQNYITVTIRMHLTLVYSIFYYSSLLSGIFEVTTYKISFVMQAKIPQVS